MFIKESNAFIVLGERWNKAIKEIEPNTRIVQVKNAISIPRECIKWNDEVFRVIYLGVLIPRKGVADILKTVKKIKDSNFEGNVQLVIAGSGCEEERLKQMSFEMGIANIVEFIGWVDDKRKKELLQSSQLLVLPSYNEGLPVAILEAISYGLPIVATNVGDVSAAVHEGKNGYLIEPGDVDALEQAIKIFIVIE